METDEYRIRHVVETWHEASRSFDFDLLLSLMTDDAILLLPGQQPVPKSQLAKAQPPPHRAPHPIVDGPVNIKEIQVHGNVAFLWAELTATLSSPISQNSTTKYGHRLTILKKVNGNWLIARDANLLQTVDP